MSNTTLKRRITKAHEEMCESLMAEIDAHIQQVAEAVAKNATIEDARAWFLCQPDPLDSMFARMPSTLGEQDDVLCRRLDESGCKYEAVVMLAPMIRELAQVLVRAGDDVVRAVEEEQNRLFGDTDTAEAYQ